MKKLFIAVITVVIAVLFAGCAETIQSTEKKDAQYMEKTQTKLKAKIGQPDVNDSLELRNLKKRYELLDDKNKVGYVYLISHGLIFAQYTVEGKVSSLESQFTNPSKVVKADYGEGWESNVIDQAEPDGSYGKNPQGIFFWTTDGVYVEWAGDFLYSDERLAVQQPTQNVITKPIR